MIEADAILIARRIGTEMSARMIPFHPLTALWMWDERTKSAPIPQLFGKHVVSGYEAHEAAVEEWYKAAHADRGNKPA